MTATSASDDAKLSQERRFDKNFGNLRKGEATVKLLAGRDVSYLELRSMYWRVLEALAADGVTVSEDCSLGAAAGTLMTTCSTP